MTRTFNYHIWPKDLDFSEKLSLLPKFAANREMCIATELNQVRQITFNKYESATAASFEEFVAALKKNPRFTFFYLEAIFRAEKPEKAIRFTINFKGYSVEVTVQSNDDDLAIVAHSFVRDEFRLGNPSIPDVDRERERNLQATIFLGRHFEEDANKPSASLTTFLSLLGFRVVTAEKYTAEAIPNKVKKLIDEQYIYIGLVTSNREHSWLISESAYAQGKGKHVMMVVEDGANFNPAISGKDYERIPIEKGHVEQSFIKLLQEFRSVGISGM